MAIDYEKLLALAIPDTQQSYTRKDAILYALSLGYGADPMDAAQLPFVFEPDLQAVPTMGVVLAHPGYWPRLLDTGLNWVKIVHAEQGLVLHKPLPPEAHVIGKSRVVDIIDKGAEKGALISYERRILERDTGEPLCTISQTMLARADGGFGGPARSALAPHAIPDRPADFSVEMKTQDNAALLYRLNGDWNPLHADPEVARNAGFERPILHGLATWGIAGHAVLKTACNYHPSRIKSIFGRFTAPVYPGETFRTDVWVDGNIASFTVRAVERNVIAINNGKVELRD
ncbi:MaoC/PaaZ C-terminal domain-containing protein [Noviherbaspirillum saxi]|uniref:3-alpha,7-alpha, 12-alpha-trihydroxy-5-beta-cholest-24-enoyl-CoA hydratase n=1 Tax=Noviherbaspirillum saxi TaxID=2320863 RepID=A0A3A3FK12_9BURK|nr:MaoC/PaaZ C-terminal domain-containing protein [Noviherbaspirillum saxi]RJF91675.1 3-alpha,7-alpha,12-alpha-trihydroxy-5-beta-cholest-24-enoyl-CoA hydratase [Noviherbaspirillum saxi]